jgi:hypothetical protein
MCVDALGMWALTAGGWVHRDVAVVGVVVGVVVVMGWCWSEGWDGSRVQPWARMSMDVDVSGM